ncbi:XopG/HopH/AvrPtoH family type III secretion system effector [Burkholderia sola]
MMKVQSNIVPSITIESSSDTAIRDAEKALAKINSGRNGHALLSALESFGQSGKRVKIFVPPRGGNLENVAIPVDDIDNSGTDNKAAVKNATKSVLGLKGKGSSAIVEWNPSKALVLNAAGEPIGRQDDTAKAYLSLGHELVHAYRIAKGTYTGSGRHDGFRPGTRAADEELRAVGLGKWANEPISENGIRADHVESRRTAYPLSQDEGERLESFDPTARYVPDDV